MRSYKQPGSKRILTDERASARSVWSMYQRLFTHAREQWRKMLLALVAIIVISLMEFAIPQLTAYTIDHVIPDKRYSELLWIGAGILGAALFLGLFTYLSSYLLSYIGQHTINRLRNELYQHLQKQDMAFLIKTGQEI